MAKHQAGRNIHRRNAGSRRPFGSHRGALDLRTLDQPGPGRTGAGAGAGEIEGFRGQGDVGAVALLEDCGGRARVGDSEGGRGLGRLGSFEHAA